MATAYRQLDDHLDVERNKIRTDKLDITYGELASMYERREFQIAPDYQRLFRWDLTQQTRFIESILLGFPTPAIFVAESDDGVWELVDGLQRVSTVLKFIGILACNDGTPNEPSTLAVEDIKHAVLPELDGIDYSSLSLRSQLSIKRASCRVEVIKVGSISRMKYEVFERLNTGGSELTAQEIRNCIFRAQCPRLMTFVDELAEFPPFASSLDLSEFQQRSMYDRGLVLRFFTLKNIFEEFEHEVDPFITEYARGIAENELSFDYEAEAVLFRNTFQVIADALGEDCWRHLRNGKHKGPFSVYVFDALSVAVARNWNVVSQIPVEELRKRCLLLKEDSRFVQNTGAGANIKSRMRARLSTAIEVIRQG